MTVEQLIQELRKYPPTADIQVWDPYNDKPTSDVQIEYDGDSIVAIR